MTEIRYQKYKDDVEITLKGHAGYNPGNDIVCAGVSTITYQLLNTLEDLSNKNKVTGLSCDLKEGDVKICFHINSPLTWRTVWNVILIGYETLAEAYPSNVRLVGVNVSEHYDK